MSSFFENSKNWLRRQKTQVDAAADAAQPVLDRIGDQADEAWDWIAKDDGAKKWLSENWSEMSEMIDQSYPTDMPDLERLEKALVGISQNVQQISEKRARRLATVIAGKLGGAAGVGGIAGLISAFGAASTGTAIASLSGAAATTAKLYWVGSIIGLGTTAGATILTVGGIGLAIGTAYLTKRYVVGKVREAEKLQKHEQALLIACATLLAGIQQEKELSGNVSRDQLQELSKYALLPILDNLNSYWTDDDMKRAGVKDAMSYRKCLAILPFNKLRTHRNELTKLVIGALANEQE